MASHPVGHSAAAAKNRSGTYYSNRSRWPFEQVRMLVAARKELADWRGASRYAQGCALLKLSLRFVFAIAASELAEIRPSRNYSESSFFWRESKRGHHKPTSTARYTNRQLPAIRTCIGLSTGIHFSAVRLRH